MLDRLEGSPKLRSLLTITSEQRAALEIFTFNEL
jgi:hypothetical protein